MIWLNFISRPDPSIREDEISFFYQGCSIKSFFIVVLDGGRFEMPLPKIIRVKGYDYGKGHDEVVGLSNHVVKEIFYPLDDHPVEKVVLTEIELTLCRVLSGCDCEEYFRQLKLHNKLEITTISTK
jgi:hypothetical protein